MAQCTVTAEPGCEPGDLGDSGSQAMPLFSTDSTDGDFIIAGVGTRNTGSGTINIEFPFGVDSATDIVKATLFWNVYVANDIDVIGAPLIVNGGITLTSPDGDTFVVGTPGPGVDFDASTTCIGISKSTCWVNPAKGGDPAENTTYLRNRSQRVDVTTFMSSGNNIAQAKYSGDYTVSGLPVDLSQAMVNGIRTPGCESSQGAILVIVYKWNKRRFGPKRKTYQSRIVRIYNGSVMLAFGNNLTTFGGSNFFSVTDTTSFFGNMKFVYGIGDAETGFGLGDAGFFRGVRHFKGDFAIPNQGNVLSLRGFRSGGRTSSTVTVQSLGDCLNWFLFVISGDNSSPFTRFFMINCKCGNLALDATAASTTLIVTNAAAANFPPLTGGQWGPFFIGITSGSNQGEIIQVIETSGIVWTVLRGQLGTGPGGAMSEGDEFCLITTNNTIANWFRENCKKGVEELRMDSGEQN